MKKALFISVLFIVGIIVCSCGQKNPKTTSNTTNNETSTTNNNNVSNASNNGPANGTYNASGTITFTAGGMNYSCSISKVIAASTSLTIQTSTADVKTNGSIIITCYTATSAITTGTYTASSAETISSVSFVDKNVTPYSSTATTAGSSCTVNITSLTSTSIKGTFTATVLTPLDNSSLSITEGVIDCTITTK
jgi:hypothetical protein